MYINNIIFIMYMYLVHITIAIYFTRTYLAIKIIGGV